MTLRAVAQKISLNPADFATAEQGDLADSAVQPAQLDQRLSAAQRSAIDSLTVGTSTVDDIIAALQATT